MRRRVPEKVRSRTSLSGIGMNYNVRQATRRIHAAWPSASGFIREASLPDESPQRMRRGFPDTAITFPLT
jgi:hypothetical protein